MEENFNQTLQPEKETQSTTQTITETEKETKVGLEGLADLPRIEDLLRSEKEIKPSQNFQGLTTVNNNSQKEDKPFTLKKDEKKAYVKKRVKVLTSVYVAVVGLLFAFVFGNAITMAVLSKKINSNTDTIQSRSEIVQAYEINSSQEEQEASGTFQVKLNEPRDYSDDTKELTFFDKLTILFRNLFG